MLDADTCSFSTVNLYIKYAELQALERKAMTMHDWITKLDEFLRISGRKLLDHAGKISAESAKAKADLEYVRYRALLDAQPQREESEQRASISSELQLGGCRSPGGSSTSSTMTSAQPWRR